MNVEQRQKKKGEKEKGEGKAEFTCKELLLAETEIEGNWNPDRENFGANENGGNEDLANWKEPNRSCQKQGRDGLSKGKCPFFLGKSRG